MNKKITITITLLLILSIIICIVGLKKEKDKDLVNINDKNISFIFETDKGNVTGSSEDWLSDEYKDYELDIENSKCNGKTSPSELKWNNENHSVEINSGIAEKCTLYFAPKKPSVFDNCVGEVDLVKCLNTLNNETEFADGDGYLYHHDSSLANGAGDNGYRYAGNQPNNYICFGNGSESYNNGTSNQCPLTNKYRIIGLVPVITSNGSKQTLVKIIKAEYITADELGINSTGTAPSSSSYTSLKRIEGSNTSVPGFYWNSSGNNTWKDSSLYNVLNGAYLTKLGDWQNKVETVKWNVGGGTDANLRNVNAQNAYKQEIKNGSGTTVEAKVGLMYVHDYGFASKKDNWTTKLHRDNDNNSQANWLFNGVNEWTISRHSSNSNYALYVYSAGFVSTYSGVNGNSYGVRPVLYLTSDVKLSGGAGIDGSQSKPYKVS